MEDNKKSGRGTLWKIVVCVALLVFLVSGGLTLHSYLADKRAQEEYERLAREAAQTTQETITIEETEKQELETEPEKEEYQSPYDFEKLKEENLILSAGSIFRIRRSVILLYREQIMIFT